MIKGLTIGGNYSSVIVRQHSQAQFEIGELLIVDINSKNNSKKMILQIIDLEYGSQISQQDRELVSGLELEENAGLSFMDEHLRSYTIARAKILAINDNSRVTIVKVLPPFFSKVRTLENSDATFLECPDNPLLFGFLRSGSRIIDVPVNIDGTKVLSHHILVSGTTGKGKSMCIASLLWDSLSKDFGGILVLDPHDEYFTFEGSGLQRHPRASEKLAYYSINASQPGARSLRVNFSLLVPHHFDGVVEWSDAQRDLLALYYRKFKDSWISKVLLEEKISDSKNKLTDATLAVVRRKLITILDVDVDIHVNVDVNVNSTDNSIVSNGIVSNGIFDMIQGEGAVADIVGALRSGWMVIIDTSSCSGSNELLLGSLIASEILSSAKRNHKHNARNISIVLEEAPRVLSREILAHGSNVFATIAREGRKFGVGLIAITQLPSLIPKEILANINTKIILGTEMKSERLALIESSPQDLSEDDRAIASLDKGEAIITSTFTKLALPVKIPFFKELVLSLKNSSQSDQSGQSGQYSQSGQSKLSFGGMKI